MFKSRLQELSQKHQWELPVYTVDNRGPEHRPCFSGSVAVHGRTFNSPDLYSNSKDARNKAAEVAFNALANAVLEIPRKSSVPRAPERDLLYKAELDIFLRKKRLLPRYSYIHEGPEHSLRFKATVEVDGKTFRSKQFYNTVREAEHDAAKQALLGLPSDENQQEESGRYKNLLHELAYKEGFTLPVYRTVKHGELHMPMFSSIAEIGGERFNGDVGNSKKKAEMNAAKVAWFQLEERTRRVPRSGSTIMDSKQVTAPSIQLLCVKKEGISGGVKKEVQDATILDENRLGSAITVEFQDGNTVKMNPSKPDIMWPQGNRAAEKDSDEDEIILWRSKVT